MNLTRRSPLASLWTWTIASWPVLIVALVQFGLHMWVAAHDNLFGDELYYIAASHHLDLGYVDFPPLIAFTTAAVRLVLGESLLAIRLLPALAGALLILLTADMVARLGGGRLAQLLAAIAVGLGPVFIGTSGILTMDVFDEVWWALMAWVLLRMITEQRPRLWLLFGLFAGLGLLNKLTTGFYIGALVIGLLLSDQRRLLFNRWLLFGGSIALALILPYIVWNGLHGFATIEFTRNYAGGKTFQVTPIQFFLDQAVGINLLALPLWFGSLYFVFFTPPGRTYRAFGWAYLLLFILFMLLKTKFYWLMPAYPVLFALSAYGLGLLIERRPRLAWLQPTGIGLLAVSGLFFTAFAIPILPVQTFIRLRQAMGGSTEVQTENLATGVLPQTFAARYGWRELVTAVRQAYDTLTPQEKSEACVFTSNYAEAGAIDFYGPALGLPRAISGHNSYFIWGPQGCSGKVLITVGVPLSDLLGNADSIRFAGSTECTYCMPYENGAPIIVIRGLHYDIQQDWPSVRHYD